MRLDKTFQVLHILRIIFQCITCQGFGDAHIYKNHIEPLQTQLQNSLYPFPKLEIKERGQEKVEDFILDDFEFQGYQCNDKISMKMAV